MDPLKGKSHGLLGRISAAFRGLRQYRHHQADQPRGNTASHRPHLFHRASLDGPPGPAACNTRAAISLESCPTPASKSFFAAANSPLTRSFPELTSAAAPARASLSSDTRSSNTFFTS